VGTYITIIAGIISFIVAVVLSPIIIPVLRKLKFGQSIRQIGPSWHNKKSGTPTMGGIIFIIAIGVSLMLSTKTVDVKVIFAFLCALGFGIIGFIDDFIKVVVKRNLGLHAWQKLSLQIIVAVVFVFVGLNIGELSTVIHIPFYTMDFDLGLMYIPFAIFVILGVVNSVNLTDGIDGLATSVTIIVMLFFGIIGSNSFSLFSYITIGGLLGFLLFNKYPARVFMGDTGSLFLGGVVASVALLQKNPLILIIVGLIYLFESLSVIIQVASFKLTGKRVFKMSPIHHHFEMTGWSEKKIVRVFTGLTIILSIIAYFGSGVIN